MKISDLLCSSGELEDKVVDILCPSVGTRNQEEARPQLRQGSLTAGKPSRPLKESSLTTVVPDKQRKRPYRMSASQKLSRQANEEYESRVFNLTLDNNQLRQQVQHLLECRDLYLTRLFVYRQQIESDVLSAVEKLVNGFSERGPGFTSTAGSRERMVGSKSNQHVHDLVLARGKHVLSHRSWSSTSIQVLRFVEDDEDEGVPEAAETRRMCDGSNGCVVEAVGVFTGRIKREMLTGLYPHVLSDEAFVARTIGFAVACPVRLVVYFDSNRCITLQVAQVDVLASMDHLRQARPSDYVKLMKQYM